MREGTDNLIAITNIFPVIVIKKHSQVAIRHFTGLSNLINFLILKMKKKTDICVGLTLINLNYSREKHYCTTLMRNYRSNFFLLLSLLWKHELDIHYILSQDNGTLRDVCISCICFYSYVLRMTYTHL